MALEMLLKRGLNNLERLSKNSALQQVCTTLEFTIIKALT